jgi:hypothetical protein
MYAQKTAVERLTTGFQKLKVSFKWNLTACNTNIDNVSPVLLGHFFYTAVITAA